MWKDPIIFKSEDSMWQMLASGQKTWEGRRYDMVDDRIYRLSFGDWESPPKGRQPSWEPVEAFVGFQNKATGEILQFRYRGMEFAPWAPGWCFLILGGLVGKEKSDE